MASAPLLHLHHFNLHRHNRPTLHNLKLPTTTAAHRRAASTAAAPSTAKISMSYSPTPAADRLISAVAYTLPFFNSLHYGHHLLVRYPPLAAAFDPILPLFSLYRSIPYASFVAFFALYLGVVRNAALSRYARFNAMQAVVLDVLLVVPLLVGRILSPGRGGFGARVMAMGHSGLFVLVCVCFVYSLACCVLGRTPYLPFVADAAGRQL
ncbi:protein TIC 20-II, chloroplastic-like [Malania oleifera]|uniref:protein TIC 20-II, chloroplastic-like n=1 Tax=Malania oleifera TaxID=397392 RepID=UPI0025AE223B|nr:protein TIC 20-II, chloroplastic-like [Malania oleifera]